uniref:Uncharacterized protein n=1 Tax=Myoviridae sp. ctj3P51 TaxID=2826687 RepID=A0A8S5NP05_9CAUD|nr:MAG TPA: hypothetical protein [Myoviridae sp. ctj3P51]
MISKFSQILEIRHDNNLAFVIKFSTSIFAHSYIISYFERLFEPIIISYSSASEYRSNYCYKNKISSAC